MKRILALVILFSGLINIFGGSHVMAIGKEINLEVLEGEVIDADYFQKVLDDKLNGVVTNLPVPISFLENIVKYMRENNLKLAPGFYKFYQGWQFEDGKFIKKGFIWDIKREVFKFQKID